MDTTQSEKIRTGRGFLAALDQSGEYGIDAEMFDLVYQVSVSKHPAS